MSLLCIGASHDGVDVSDVFVSEGLVWIDWDDYPDLHNVLKRAPVGTMIAIKSWHPTAGLKIKAVGFIKNDAWRRLLSQRVIFGREVKWLSTTHHDFERIHDKMDNMRNGSIYYEQNERLVGDILSLIV